MSIGFVAFGCILLFTMPLVVELTVCIRIGVCLWRSFWSVVVMGTACLTLMMRTPNLASTAEGMMALMILLCLGQPH